MKLNQFVDSGSDNSTLNEISKSLSPDILEKALDKSKLVQVDVQYRTKSGKIATRKQWKSAGESTQIDSPKPHPKDIEETHKREQIPATPHNITEKTKHLIPWTPGNELPEHIKSLKKPIPPNWRNVMISPHSDSEVLVIGKDDMNRTQYIYNEDFVAQRVSEKFERVRDLMNHKDKLASFIDSLEDKDVSDCLKLIMQMGIRPGSNRDTKAKVEALGATTLRGENVIEEDGTVYLRFTGKKGVHQDHLVPSTELSKMLLERKQKSGDSGNLFDTTDAKLRKALSPLGIHTKDLRTLLANTIAQDSLKSIPSTSDAKEFGKIRNQVGSVVCEILGNRREESLRSYIDPEVFRKWSSAGIKNWENEKNGEIVA
jgi:DNA topoisomerase IB